MHPETNLIKQIRKRNRKALEELHDRYAPVLLSLSLRYCGNRPDAEDVLQDAFIRILSGLDSFVERSGGSFEGWLKRITVNTALNFLREKNKIRKWVDSDPLADKPEDDTGQDLMTDISGILRQEELLQMISELPDGYRAVFNMYVFEDFSHKEIADILGCTENTSKSQLHKARAMLKKKVVAAVEKQAVRT